MPRRPAPRPKHQVFVSHATADKGVILLLCEKIDALPGVCTFRDDRDLGGGESIPANLREAFERSAEMLVFLTPTSVTRPWVLHEIGIMWGMGKRIVAVFHLLEPPAFPPLVREVKAYRLEEFDQYLAELKRRVKGG